MLTDGPGADSAEVPDVHMNLIIVGGGSNLGSHYL